MALTGRTQVPNEIDAFYDRQLLLRVIPLFTHLKFGQMRPIPRNAGSDVIRFRRYANLAAALTPLTEGVTPGGSQLSTTEITATVDQYGDFIEISDKLDFLSIDPVMMEAMDILGDQAGDTLDQLTRDVINAGTSVAYAGTAVSRITVAAGDLITTALIDEAVNILKNNNARKLTPMMGPNQNISTSPLDRSFWAIVHPDVARTLRNLTGFIPVENYPGQQGVMEGEMGAYNQVRFIESTNAAIFAGAGAAGIDVYSVLVLASDAYGITEVSGEGLKSYRKPFGSAGTADPLDQRGTAGWKATHVARILNDAFMHRIEVAGS